MWTTLLPDLQLELYAEWCSLDVAIALQCALAGCTSAELDVLEDAPDDDSCESVLERVLGKLAGSETCRWLRQIPKVSGTVPDWMQRNKYEFAECLHCIDFVKWTFVLCNRRAFPWIAQHARHIYFDEFGLRRRSMHAMPAITCVAPHPMRASEAVRMFPNMQQCSIRYHRIDAAVVWPASLERLELICCIRYVQDQAQLARGGELITVTFMTLTLPSYDLYMYDDDDTLEDVNGDVYDNATNWPAGYTYEGDDRAPQIIDWTTMPRLWLLRLNYKISAGFRDVPRSVLQRAFPSLGIPTSVTALHLIDAGAHTWIARGIPAHVQRVFVDLYNEPPPTAPWPASVRFVGMRSMRTLRALSDDELMDAWRQHAENETRVIYRVTEKTCYQWVNGWTRVFDVVPWWFEAYDRNYHT